MPRVPGLIECVPNFSEGRRPEVVDEIVAAIGHIEGITLLDHSRDETHNRSVVTFAGSAEPVVRAATAAVGRALELIDMEAHTGAHHRLGRAGEGDDAAVVRLVARVVEEGDALDVADGGDDLVHHLGAPALAEVRNALDQSRHAGHRTARSSSGWW